MTRSINASELARIMQCDAAEMLAEKSPKRPIVMSETKRESEAAHKLLNALLNNPQASMSSIDGFIITPDMQDHIGEIASVIHHRDYGATVFPAPEMDTWHPVDGTTIHAKPDCVAWNGKTKTLYVDELKYGWRCAEVKRNYQLLASAIAVNIHMGLSPSSVVLTIHQPRPFHPDGKTRTITLTRNEFAIEWNAIIERLKHNNGYCTTGSECYGCAAAAICPSSMMAASAAIEVSHISASDDIDNDQLGVELLILERAEEAIKIRKKSLQEIATHRIMTGVHIPHWSVKSSQGNRKWVDGVNAAVIQSITGIDVSEAGIISPAQAEKKGVSKDIVNSFTTRPSTGFKLVQQDLTEVFK